MDWILERKEWIFSGIGVLIISVIISIIVGIFKAIGKKGEEKRKLKRIVINIEKNKLSLTKTNDENIFAHNLKVSYKNNQYSNLCYVMINVKNFGLKAIENSNILITFPQGTTFIDESQKFCNSMIKFLSETQINHENKIELIKKVDRLEPNDYFKIMYLIDTKNSDRIDVEIRGVDDVDCNYINLNKGIESDERLAKLLTWYIILDSIPFLGWYLKTLLVTYNFSSIEKLVSTILFDKKKIQSQNISVTESSHINLNVKDV